MLGSHITMTVKRGCQIVTCDPATQTIEAKIQRGEIVPVNAYYYTPVFRWPSIGEIWILREENGSWFLDSIYEEQKPTRFNEAQVKINAGPEISARMEPIKL